MASAETPRIVLCAEEPGAVDDLRQLLSGGGYTTGWQPLDEAAAADLASSQLILVEGSRSRPEALRFCRRLRASANDGFVPVLFVTDDHSPETRLASLQHGADTYLLRPFSAGELLAQVQAFLRIKETHDRLSEKTAEVHRVNKRLQTTYHQIDQELELARRVQQSFLPAKMPEMPGARFAVHYRPCGKVGGDFYDVFRLDEGHVGLYVADAMGHGVPASLLTVFLKNGVRPKEISGQRYRLVPSGEVLGRLNRDLIEQKLSEQPFVTMVYGLLDVRERRMQFARAGHPYPLHVPASEPPELWHVSGSLMGVFETEFPVQNKLLQAGDKLLFFTDGMDAAAFGDRPAGTESLRACAEKHKALPIDEFVERLAWELFHQAASQPDDLTILGVEMTG
jgi:sigma-B regulation protein RsbU (phosphoserine phosphatase)